MSNVKFFIIIIAINPSVASSLVQVRAVITGKQPVATGHLSQRPEVNALTRFVRQIFSRGRDSEKAGRDQNF